MTKDQRSWNAVALAVFVGLAALSVVLVNRYADIQPSQLGFFDLTVLGLGTFRLVHLLTFDKIFEPIRSAFMVGSSGKLAKAPSGWRRLMCEFLECIWCTGMWSGLFAVTVYFLGSWGRFAVVVFAVAGLGSLFQVLSKMMAER